MLPGNGTFRFGLVDAHNDIEASVACESNFPGEFKTNEKGIQEKKHKNPKSLKLFSDLIHIYVICLPQLTMCLQKKYFKKTQKKIYDPVIRDHGPPPPNGMGGYGVGSPVHPPPRPQGGGIYIQHTLHIQYTPYTQYT